MKKLLGILVLGLLLNGCGEPAEKVYPKNGMFPKTKSHYELFCIVDAGPDQVTFELDLKIQENYVSLSRHKSELKFKTKETLIIENLNEKISEKLLFTLWNIALQDNKYFLITSTKPLNSYKFKMNDLVSRVNSSLIIGITLPSDDLISVILAKNFSDKQIKVEKSISITL